MEIFRKEVDGSWSSVRDNELSDEIELRSIGVPLALSHIYDRVFPAAPAA